MNDQAREFLENDPRKADHVFVRANGEPLTSIITFQKLLTRKSTLMTQRLLEG